MGQPPVVWAKLFGVNFVDVLRGGFPESRHAVHAAVVNASGQLVASVGNPNFVTFMRSSAKPFQAIVFAEAFPNVDSRLLAIACASHAGEDVHVETVRELQALLGVQESWLVCGSHQPFDEITRQELRARNEKSGVLRNNCSGKHSAMLAGCVAHTWPHVGYASAGHPLQLQILEILQALSGDKNILVATDGCGVPCYSLPLLHAARAVAKLVVPGAAPQHAAALEKIFHAMHNNSYLVAGREQLDTVLMQALPGVVSKIGADGYQILALRDSKHGPLAVALKIEDGAERARDAAVLRILAELGLLNESDPRFAGRARKQNKNHAGFLVGETIAGFGLNWL